MASLPFPGKTIRIRQESGILYRDGGADQNRLPGEDLGKLQPFQVPEIPIMLSVGPA